ncbi:ATP-binding cassette domain-containing protein [Streptomyces eurythermus]|uniref:ATP-binding cassette domain-containing protein n=1 Tax=Streptomyces eurythermus TaxID=42237 RepID=UPI0036FA8F4A
MIEAFGLTSNPRKAHPPAVDDVSFEARAGQVTALLGRAGAGKTTTLRLMLELQQGRGITYFRGRPLHRIAHPAREVGVLLGDVPGHPARSVRGHLRMLCAASGVPARRADEVLEVVGLVSLREERLGTLSRGMDRRLGLACALLPDPHTLVLDEPADGLSAREAQWLHSMLRAHADQGGTVLFTTAEPKEAARTADRVVTLDGGRLVADQEARVFARTRLRRRVAVRSPHAARLAALLTRDARTARRSVEVVREGGNRLSVYGSTTADVGEIAFRHGILVHQLADEVGDMGPGAGAGGDDGARPAEPRPPVPDSPPAGRRARPEQDPAATGVPYGERKSAPAGRVWNERGRTAPEPALDGRPVGLSGAPEAPARSARDVSAESRQARQSDPRESAKAGFAAAEPRSAEPAAEPRSAEPAAEPRSAEPAAEPRTASSDRAAAQLRSTSPHRSTPEPHTPAQGLSTGNATASGHPAGQRKHTPAVPPTPGAEPAVADSPPNTEGRWASGRSASRRAGSADSGLTPGAARRTQPARPVTAPSASPRDAAPAGAAFPADGTAPTVTASGANGTVGEARERAARQPHRHTGTGVGARNDGNDGRSRTEATSGTGEGGGDGRSAGSAAGPETGSGADTSSSRPQTDGMPAPVPTGPGTRLLLPGARNPGARKGRDDHAGRSHGDRAAAVISPLPPPIAVRPAPSPLRPLRYEIRRAAGIGTGFLTCGAVLVVSALTAVLLARIGHTPQARLFAAWPRELPLPPAALGSGLLGALAFGDEFRHPALAADRGTVPRRLGLLTAKLLVSGVTAGLLAFLALGCDAEVLYLVYGRELTEVPADWLSLTASWFGLVVGCSWAGVLAAGVFRSTTAGLAAVLAVPVLVVPLVHKVLQGPAVRVAADFPVRMREVFLLQWPFGGERYLLAAARVVAQPVGGALALSLAGLLCAYLHTALRTRLR